ncbi:unnamed protein product [Rotaria sp. Silwood1]|nr:unnamed protein product [Rotaria sp. Silwood1]CAF0764008.1 unnamed protein product [Rotaria sp. Silwood1]CAF0786734.1 unnamed protein product [Rotaria sp. Silwood1]CAF3319377.1 unnamed protein product [Rotaria sp. Silwood1]CAF3342289.1 unnamed protein product [Rotaria sp. Silwood1]
MLHDVCCSQTPTRTRNPLFRHRLHNSPSPASVLSLTPSPTTGMIQSAAPGEFSHRCATVPFDSIYNITEDLCRGRFSSVKKCVKKEVPDQIFAAKIIKKRNIQHALNELRIFQLSHKHSNFVSLHQVFDLPTEAIFILEYAKQGDLQLALELEGCLEEIQAIHVTKQVLDAVAFLHDNKIVHLDIKPQNILLMEKWPSTQIKLCDFGLSRVLTNQRLLEMSGTTDFLAPEVVNYEPLTCATDMWNIGVLIYVLVTGHTPFGGATKLDTQNNITHCILDFPSDLFEKISKKCIDLIRKLIVRMPKRRATVHESLKHPWICLSDETTLSNEQIIDSLDEEEEVAEEEIDELTNEIDAQNFN